MLANTPHQNNAPSRSKRPVVGGFPDPTTLILLWAGLLTRPP